MRILLLAGGAGTRLWPLSTEERPKQFLPLLSAKSLIAETYERVRPLSGDVWVATAERYAPLVSRELPELRPERILTEPARRNSGPALLSAAVRFARDGDPITAAIPSDQTVRDADAFRRALTAAAELADSAAVVMLAARPSRPETDYGYMECVAGGAVKGFTEKPPPEQAREFAASGRHFWNAGIFVLRPSRFLAEARRVAADLTAGVERYVSTGARADYEALPEISIDYAVIERASELRAVPLVAGWSDVGTWRAVRELRGGTDGDGNIFVADVPVVAPGVRDTAVVVGEKGVLVLPLDRESELREAVERLRRSPAPPPKPR
jgi:mannose-1-phosphate guanylyltransferase